MKTHRKNLLAAAAAAALFLVAGCSAAQPAGTPASGEPEKKVLVAAADITYPPFEYMEGDVAVGFDIDLWKELCSRMGYEGEHMNFPWDGIVAGLQAKKFDAIVADMEITEDKKDSVLFSDPYFLEAIGCATRTETGIKSLEDLSGKIVGLQTGTLAENWARQNAEKYGIPSDKFVAYETMPDAILDLQSGRIDAVINNAPFLQYTAKDKDDLFVLPPVVFDEPLYSGIAFNLEDTELCAQVNKALAEVIADGTYAKIYRDWFGTDPNEHFMPKS